MDGVRDDRDQILGPIRKTCLHCNRRCTLEELEKHENECVFNPDSRAASLAASLEKKKKTFTKGIPSSSDCPSFPLDAKLTYRLKEARIRDKLDILKERWSKATTVAIFGSVESGKTTIKNHLRTDKCTFFDHDGSVNVSKNFIKESSMSDYVLFVFDASKDPIKGDGLGALVANCLDIKPIVCCLNKMDLLSNPKEVYPRLKQKVIDILRPFGFEGVPCVPTSAVSGENISEKSTKFGWYKGPTVLEALGEMDTLSKQRQPLRIVVHEVSADGRLVSGMIHSGKLATSEEMVFCPGCWCTTVEQIVVDTKLVNEAYPGEYVTVKLKEPLDGREVKAGTVISSPNREPAKEVENLAARLFVYNPNTTLKEDATYYIATCHMAEVSAFVSRIFCRVKMSNSEVVERPLSLQPRQFGVVKLVLLMKMTLEIISEYPTLGRILLLDNQRNILAFGTVIRAVAPSPPPAEPSDLVKDVLGEGESSVKEPDVLDEGEASKKKKSKKKGKKKKKGGTGRH